MSSTADWIRPSTILLLLVVLANVALPVSRLWGGAEEPAPSKTDRASRTEPAPQAAPVPRRPPAPAPRLTLSPDPSRHAGAADPPAAPPEQPAARVSGAAEVRPAASVCRAWGPFEAMEAAEAAASQLQLAPGSFEVVGSEVGTTAGHLVYVATGGSRRIARRIAGELESHGIESYVMGGTRLANAVSAGVFSDPERARAQQQRVIDLGYDARVEALERSRRVYHLTARVPADFEAQIPSAGACDDIAPMRRFL